MKPKDRLCYDKQTYYQNSVLVGNWVEEKIGSYKRTPFKHASTYSQDFIPKYALDKNENDFTYNTIKIKSEIGENVASQKITDDIERTNGNFSSTYDLSFKYFPSCYKESMHRKMRFRLLSFEPTNEYLNDFGNLSTRNGLVNYKKEIWDYDLLDPRRPLYSVTKADYKKYDPEAYKSLKWPRLQPLKINCGNAKDLIYPPMPSHHPRIIQLQKDPITWDNSYENHIVPKCICDM
ncbi:unnamed protein product [Ceutorhynchus assimilis]|uniref:Uncharacterized protein n=1 Tax=Ceutorhynchus assimilis TaxID=467358 RepID=A0A9N9ML54_9CUCU|nr:unnamed protein product [Ceutorhynchus assimilis]